MPLNNPTPSLEYHYGEYTGDGTANKAIAHQCRGMPAVVFIWVSGGQQFTVNPGGTDRLANLTSTGQYVTTTMTTTNFYVGNVASMAESMNSNGSSYKFLAIYAA